MTPLSIPYPCKKFRLRRRDNLTSQAILSSFAALVIFVLFAAGICAALARRLSA